MSKHFEFDFGFENRTVGWDEAKVVLLFLASCKEADIGVIKGPAAIADASRYAEFYQIEDDFEPFEIGVCAEFTRPSELSGRIKEALSHGKIPIIINDDRQTTTAIEHEPLVALWGALGSDGKAESAAIENRQCVIAGVRAAASSSPALKAPNTAVVTYRSLCRDIGCLAAPLSKVAGPIHLSIDLDVLSPGTAQNNRSIEPGGLSWYELLDVIDMVFLHSKFGSLGLVGVKSVEPKTPAALLCAQILIALIGKIAKANKL